VAAAMAAIEGEEAAAAILEAATLRNSDDELGIDI